jgi:hypothetical protein
MWLKDNPEGKPSAAADAVPNQAPPSDAHYEPSSAPN